MAFKDDVLAKLVAARDELKSGAYHKKWVAHNPGENAKVEAYWSNGGTPPSLATHYGRAQVFDGEAYWLMKSTNIIVGYPVKTTTVSSAVADAGARVPSVSSSVAVYNLVVSTSSNRSSPVSLSSSTLSGNSYVFLDSDQSIQSVSFYLDGVLVKVENAAPYDYAGTAADGTANPWDTSSSSNGSHTIRADVTLVGGGVVQVSATFTVSNGVVSTAILTNNWESFAVGNAPSSNPNTANDNYLSAVQVFQASRAQIVSSPVYQGQRAAQYYILGTDGPTLSQDGSAQRAEHSSPGGDPDYIPGEGTETWIGFSVMFPGSATGGIQFYQVPNNDWNFFAQCHGGSGQACLQMIHRDNGLNIKTNGGTPGTTTNWIRVFGPGSVSGYGQSGYPLARDVWHRFVIGRKWSATGNGWIEVWHNGVNILPRYSGIYTTYTTYANYWKQGLYRTGSTVDSRVFHDDFRVGRTKGAVDSIVTPTPPPTGGTILKDRLMPAATTNASGSPSYPHNWEYATAAGYPNQPPPQTLVTCAATVDGIAPPTGLSRVLRFDMRAADGEAKPGWGYRTMNLDGPSRQDSNGWDSTHIWFVRYPTDWLSRTANDNIYFTDLEYHGSGTGSQAIAAAGVIYPQSRTAYDQYSVMWRWGQYMVTGENYQSRIVPAIPNFQFGQWYVCVLRVKSGYPTGIIQFWYGRVGVDSALTQTVNNTTDPIGASDPAWDNYYWYNPPCNLYGGTPSAGHVWRLYSAGFREYQLAGDAVAFGNYILGLNV